MVFYLSRKTPCTRTSSGSSLIQFTIKTNKRNLFSTPLVQIRGDTTLKQHKKKHRHLCSVHFHMYNISRMKNIKSLTFQRPAKTNTWTCSKFSYSYFKLVPLTTAFSRNKWRINGWKLDVIRSEDVVWCNHLFLAGLILRRIKVMIFTYRSSKTCTNYLFLISPIDKRNVIQHI